MPTPRAPEDALFDLGDGTPVVALTTRSRVSGMQAPTFIFDHVNRQVVTVEAVRPGDQRLAALNEAQGKHVAASGRPAPK